MYMYTHALQHVWLNPRKNVGLCVGLMCVSIRVLCQLRPHSAGSGWLGQTIDLECRLCVNSLMHVCIYVATSTALVLLLLPLPLLCVYVCACRCPQLGEWISGWAREA